MSVQVGRNNGVSVILVRGFVASRQDFADGGEDVRLVEELMVRLLEFDACEKERKFGLTGKEQHSYYFLCSEEIAR